MHKVIVYGLGKEYQTQKFILEREYEIVGLSDKNTDLKRDYKLFIEPDKIKRKNWDYIYVTSSKYYDEIVVELRDKYGIQEERIVGTRQAWWNITNYEARQGWIIRQLEQIPSGSKILDAGAGNQRYKAFCSHLKYVSQDFGKYDDGAISEGIHGAEKWKSKECDIVSDIIQIPVEDQSFDAILCSEVIEHLKNPVLAIREFSRILRNDGILILTAPFCSLTHMAPFYYSNGFSKYWYLDNLKEAGFEIISIEHNGNYFSYLAQELMRVGQMSQQYNGPAITEKEYDSLFNVLKTIKNQSLQSEGTEECLCFGMFVKARKNI
ncbi:MAG: methyltransferase domain-containing protein [Butyrivibrio sp.]|nr:methyltransferase domain-containing protein [Butyrivibrio sp.]